MIITEPKVRIVGRQVIDYGELDNFIEENSDTVRRWYTDAYMGAEQLVEISGRLCYMSFGKGRKSNKEYIENILDMRHGSVLEHTVWNFIISGVSRSFTHELVRHRAGWGYCLDPDTKILTSDLRWIPIKRLGIGDKVVGLDESPLKGNQQRKMLTTSITNINKRWSNTYKIIFTNGKEVFASPEHPWLYKPQHQSSALVWKNTESLKVGDRLKRFCDGWNHSLTEYEVGYLSGFFDGEGCISGGRIDFAQKPGEVLSYVLDLLQKLKIDSLWGKVDKKGVYKGVICSISDCVKLLGITRPRRLLLKASTLWDGRVYPKEEFAIIESIEESISDELISIETEAHTFVAEGVFTHNSQLSQRYVDESEANFIVPKIIKDNDAAFEVWKEAIKSSKEAYKTILKLLRVADIKDTLDIKARRGAARSVLPNATETIIFCTANARAIRHFIEMRASPYADAEIRTVAIQLLRLMRTEAPNIFNDYEIKTIEDGSEVAETKKIKV